MRAMIVFNPTAGQSEALEAELTLAAEVWRTEGWQVDLCPTTAPGAGTSLAKMAAEQHYDVVVAAGGDGTINDVINGLVGSNTALATLPLGTVNVWARELGLPMQPAAAATMLLHWKPRAIDLGRIGSRYFLLMAGIGLDAEIAGGINATQKKYFGALAYILRAIEIALSIRGTRVQLILDGKQKIKGRILLIVVGNTQLYGGVVKITNRASIDDGLLDVCVIKGDSLASALLHTVLIFGQRYSLDPEIAYYRARKIHIVAKPALPVQVDGDLMGKTPVTIEVMPHALQALLPPELPDNLMQSQPATATRSSRSIHRLLAWLSGWRRKGR